MKKIKNGFPSGVKIEDNTKLKSPIPRGKNLAKIWFKKIKTITILLYMCFGIEGKSQLYTGLTTYNHGLPAVLSFGQGTYLNSPGFLMAGYSPTIVPGDPSFYVDKVDEDGSFTSGSSFKKNFLLSTTGIGCNNPSAQEVNCYGVTAIEIPANGSSQYALVASFDSGVLFSTLDNNGAPVNSNFLDFPIAVTSISAPRIVQSISNQNFFYIIGSYQVTSNTGYTYLVKININGSVSWAFAYDVGSGGNFLKGLDMKVSPYSSSIEEVAIVGISNINGNDDGFFMRVQDDGLGTVNAFMTYNSATSAHDQFHCLTVAANTVPNGNPGFVVGGWSGTSFAGKPWFIKIANSGSIDWSTLINTGNSGSARVVSVVERYSSTYGGYEYYGATTTLNKMLALKIDGTGAPFFQTGNILSEFYYDDNNGSPSIAAAISFTQGSTSNDGIQLYGTTDNGNSGESFFLAQAVFNGACANCASPSNQQLTTIGSSLQGPSATSLPNLNTSSPFSFCQNFSLADNSTVFSEVQICAASSIPTTPNPGLNSRQTGLKSQESEALLSIYPTITDQYIHVVLPEELRASCVVKLKDYLGRAITVHQFENNGELVLDCTAFPDGLYFMEVTANELVFKQKIILKH